MAPTTLLFTGATGFIGGTVLSELLASTHPVIKNLRTISLLVRGQDRADKLCKLDPRLKAVLIESLSDHEILMKAASEHDIVIHTCSGFDLPSAHALMDGLAIRKKAGQTAIYIHTTGGSNLGNRPITNPSSKTSSPPIYTDTLTDDYTKSIYSTILHNEADRAYPQRTTDVLVKTLGAAYDIPTYLIMPPLIMGQGTGQYNKGSQQVPNLVRNGLKNGYVPYLGAGDQTWSAIHVRDLASAYLTILSAIVDGKPEVTGTGKDGYFFAETYHFTWAGLAKELASILGEKGQKVEGAREVDLDKAAELLGATKQVVELNFSSNSQTRAERVRALGWKPKFVTSAEEWKELLSKDVEAVIKSN